MSNVNIMNRVKLAESKYSKAHFLDEAGTAKEQKSSCSGQRGEEFALEQSGNSFRTKHADG